MMTAAELKALRQQRGWTRDQLARRLQISISRLKDYELGHTRTTPRRPAPIPPAIERVLREIPPTTPPLNREEQLALWLDDTKWPLSLVADMPRWTREDIYDHTERGF